MPNDQDTTSARPEEIRSLITRLKQRNLSERDFALLERVLDTFLSCITLIEHKNTTIKRLRKMLFGPRRDARVGSGGASSHIDEQAPDDSSAPADQPSPPKAQPQAEAHRK